jgi:hypothetical protein
MAPRGGGRAANQAQASAPADEVQAKRRRTDEGAPATVFHHTLVIIGMRGAGKTHIGLAASAAFDVPLIDMDWEYEKVHGKIMDSVKEIGWPAFRAREVDLLRSTLAAQKVSCIPSNPAIAYHHLPRALASRWPPRSRARHAS